MHPRARREDCNLGGRLKSGKWKVSARSECRISCPDTRHWRPEKEAARRTWSYQDGSAKKIIYKKIKQEMEAVLSHQGSDRNHPSTTSHNHPCPDGALLFLMILCRVRYSVPWLIIVMCYVVLWQLLGFTINEILAVNWNIMGMNAIFNLWW